MSKGAKTIIGIAAAVVIPFAAPAIAGAIGLSGAIGSALVGAGLGAGAGYATGGAKGALIGALGGGVGGFVGAGGASGLFGGAGGAAGAAAPTAGVVAPTGAGAQTASWLAGTTITPAATGITSALGGAAAPATSFGLSNIPIGDVAKLALTMFNKPSTDLTEAERQQLQRLDQIKSQGDAAYQQALNDYMALKQQGVPNPEKAFADVERRVQLASGEQRRAALARGLGPEQLAAQERAARIEATRLGAIGVEKEAERAQAAQVAAASARPDPTKMLTLGAAPAQAAIERRNIQDERNWYGQLAQGVGGMFGASKPTTGAAAPRTATAGLTVPATDYTSVAGSSAGLFDSYNYT